MAMQSFRTDDLLILLSGRRCLSCSAIVAGGTGRKYSLSTLSPFLPFGVMVGKIIVLPSAYMVGKNSAQRGVLTQIRAYGYGGQKLALTKS